MNPDFDLVCFDFWWTLVTDRGPGGGRHEYRVEAFCKALAESGREPDPAAVDELMRREWARYNQVHLEERRTLSNRERIDWMAAELGFEPPVGETWRRLDLALEESLFVSPPRLLAGIRRFLLDLAPHVDLGIISDTSYSGGATLRRLLAKGNVLQLFDVLTFSDELGRAKPDPAVFLTTAERIGVEPSRVVHVGDREETDVAGAKASGMVAVLFLGAVPDKLRRWPRETQADFVAYSLKDLGQILGLRP